MSRWLRFTLGISCAGFFIWLVLHRLDLTEVSRAIATIAWSTLATAVVFLALGYCARIVRWWLMLRASDSTLKLRRCVWPLLVSVAVNNIVPFRAGDALRVVGFRNELAAAPVRVLATLLAERILDLTVLMVLFFAGIARVKAGVIPSAYIHACEAIACIGLVAWIIALLFAPRLGSLLLRACEYRVFAARHWTQPAKGHVTQFLAALSVLRTPTLTLRLFVLSLIAWGFEGSVFAIVANGLNYSGAAIAPWFAAAAGTLATLIPSSPGYVGTFDFFAMSALTAYGATAPVAAAFALVVHTVLWLPLTFAGLTYFLLPRARPSTAPISATPAHQQEPP